MRRLLSGALAGFLLFTSGCYLPGINHTGNHHTTALAAQSLGAKTVRFGFLIGTPATSLDTDVADLTSRGIRPLLLAEGCGNTVTTAQANNLKNWAARFGPNGSFFAGRSDGAYAANFIEFCNETSYANGIGGNWWNDPAYHARADNYARRAAEAIFGINQTNPNVKLLVQAEDGGSANSAWVDHMHSAVPNLDDIVGGWSIHPYGPRSRWEGKLDRLVSFTANVGWSSAVPIDITEYGIATDDGCGSGVTPDNFGFNVDLTYAQAAPLLGDNIDAVRAKHQDRIQHFMIYQAHDGMAHCATTNRESYFGALQSNLAEKGAFSTEVRQQLAE